MKNLLSEVPIFSGLNEKALEAFLGQAKRLTAKIDEVIAREGETNDCMYLIEAGGVVIVKNINSPTPVTLAKLGPGQCFGEMCILETLPRSASARALVDSQVLQIPSTAFFKLYAAEPAQYCVVILNIARDLSHRLRNLGDAFVTRS